MSQTSYQINTDKGFEGMLADSGFKNVLSYIALNNIPFGRGVFTAADGERAFLAGNKQGSIEFDADLVTGNVTTVVLNGEEVAVDFDTDNATTLAAIAEALGALEGFEAEVSGTDTVIVTATNGLIETLTADVTEGATQADATISFTAVAASDFAGVSVSTQAIEQDIDGNNPYRDGRAVNVLTRGRAYVMVEDAVVANGSVFVRTSENTGDVIGAFRSDADSASAVEVSGARFVKGAGAGELAIVEINLP